MAGLCFLTPNAARSGTSQIPLLGTEADTPLGEGEFHRVSPNSQNRVVGGAALQGRAAPAWRKRGPSRAQGARGEALPPVTLMRALIRQPAPGPASPAKNRLLGHPAARPGQADLTLGGDSPGARATSRSWDRTRRPRGNRRTGTPDPEPAGGSSERASGGAAWADAARCDPRAEAYPASASPAPRPFARESPALLLTLHSREPGRDDGAARALSPGQRAPRPPPQ